jgi:hypothetical protein
VLSLAALPFLQTEQYQATLSLSITTIEDKELVAQTLFPNVNEQLIEIDPDTWEKLDPNNANRDFVYMRLLDSINGYFVKRFAEVDVQTRIAEEIGLDTENLHREEPFYNIYNNGFGSFSFAYTSGDRTQAGQFDKAMEDAFRDLVNEWNTEKDIFAIKLVDQAIEPSVIRVTPALQEYLLPPFAGLTIGLTLAILAPFHRKN